MVWRWFGVRIEDMKVFVVNPIAAEKFEGIGHLYRRGGINYVVVKVLTDEGVYGVGEGHCTPANLQLSQLSTT